MNKRSTFAPATTQTFIDRLAREMKLGLKKKFKKDFKKLARIKNDVYFCTPQNAQRSLRDWIEKEKKRDKKFLKKTSNFSCRLKKELLVLHPL